MTNLEYINLSIMLVELIVTIVFLAVAVKHMFECYGKINKNEKKTVKKNDGIFIHFEYCKPTNINSEDLGIFYEKLQFDDVDHIIKHLSQVVPETMIAEIKNYYSDNLIGSDNIILENESLIINNLKWVMNSTQFMFKYYSDGPYLNSANIKFHPFTKINKIFIDGKLLFNNVEQSDYTRDGKKLYFKLDPIVETIMSNVFTNFECR